MRKVFIRFAWWTGFSILLSLLAFGEAHAVGITTRVSVDSSGNQGNNNSFVPSISADGRYVAFYSYATNLVAGDTNGVIDVFVHDRQTGQTTQASVDSSGNQANGRSFNSSISADGRYVAFESEATNLVAGDTNGHSGVFVHDRQTGQTTRASVDSSGNQGNNYSGSPSISADGRYVAFISWATNLVAGDDNGQSGVFVHDRQTGQTTRVSVDSSGNQGNSNSYSPSISVEGRYVAFYSYATNLVAGDTNGVIDVFVHDRQTGQTTRVSVDSSGNQGNFNSSNPAISADGRYVAFHSVATNLVAGHTNGGRDVFVHDRQTGQTTRVSVDSSGNQGNDESYFASISADGRYVAFNSVASNLVVGDTNRSGDVFVHDRQTGQTIQVRLDSCNAGNNASVDPSISADGGYVAFRSYATNLVVGDTNGVPDIFVQAIDFSCSATGLSVSGVVRDSATHLPLSGVTVRLENGSSGVTTGSGHYSIGGLSSGCYVVSYLKSNYSPQYQNASMCSSNRTLPDVYMASHSAVYGTSSSTNSGFAADPVNTSTGNYVFQRTDLSIPGKGFPFVFSRAYNSQDNTAGPLGYGWTHNYASTHAENPDNTVTIRWGDGKTETWTPDGSGGYTPQFGVFDNLVCLGNGKSCSLTKKDRSVHQFNISRRLSRITDKNGNVLTLTYSGSSLTQVTDTSGRNIFFTYDGSNRITEIIDPQGRGVTFTYDGAGDLVSSTDPNGNVTTFTYDANHQMLTATDPRANVFVTNVYDSEKRVVTSQRDAKGGQTYYYYDTVNKWTAITNPLGQVSYHFYDDKLRLIEEQNPLGHSTSYTYDAAGNRTVVTDRNGNVTQYAYDARGNVTSKIDALSAVTTISYETNDNPLTRTDPLGATTYFANDAVGNLLHQTDPLGKVTTFTYGSWGELLTTTDANGHATVFAYDAAGNLDNTTDALGYVTRYTYDDVGRRLTKTNPRSNTTTFAYDNNSNLLSATDPLTYVTSSTYDGNNNRITSTDARGFTTHFAYDVKDLLTTVTDPLSHAASTGYDALDRKISFTDKRGAVTQYAYDNTGNLVQATDPAGGISTFTYDNNANRLTETDPLGHTTTYAYDALNRVVSRTDPLGHQETTGYDAAGRVTSRTNAKGQTTQFAYDALGRLTGVLDPNGGTVTYAYDNVGNRISMTDPNGYVTTYAYDALNRRIGMTEPLGNTTTYAYDAVGNLASMTDPNGKTTQYTYDKVNRLTQMTYWNATTVKFYYDANGNRIQMNDGIGISTYAYDALNRMLSATDGFNKTLEYAYDANGNLTTLTYPDGKLVRYTYDSMNRMKIVTDWQSRYTTNLYTAAGYLRATINPNGTNTAYSYDSVGRLTALANRKSNSSNSTVISSYAYTLDPLGNHVGVTQTEPLSPPLPLPKNLAYTYDAENRLVSAGPTTFTYDYNGNMLTKGSDTFAYDPANRLSSSTIGGVSSTYRYDGTGNRLERVAGGVTTRFVQDTNRSLPNVLVETDGSGSITSYYVYGLGLLAKILPDGTPYYYHFDSRGSTVALTDSSQSVTDAYAYGPFGEVLGAGGGTANPFRFVGRHGVVDDGNGTLQIRARYYLPEAGRFFTKDPSKGKDGDSQILNRYVYSLNNPVRFVDISGYSSQEGGTYQNYFGSSDKEHEKLLKLRIARLQSQMAYQMEADAWNAYIEQIDYAAAFAKVVQISANAALTYMGGGVFAKGTMAIEKAITSGGTVYRMIGGQLSAKEATAEAAKLMLSLYTGEVGGVLGIAMQGGADLTMDAAAGADYLANTSNGIVNEASSLYNKAKGFFSGINGGGGW